MKLSLTFVLNQGFLDPNTIKVKNADGVEEEVLYAPKRYKDIVTECYLLSKNLNTSYMDVMKLTPLERNYLLQLLKQDFDERKKLYDKEMQESREQLESLRKKKRY